MKHKKFLGYNNTGLVTLRYEVNNLDDLFNTKRFEFDDYFMHMFQTKNERTGIKKAKDLFTEMMEMIAEDMIYNNSVFIFPYPRFGDMWVADIGNRGILNYRYNIDTDGAVYSLKIGISNRIREKSKVFHRGRFNEINQKKLNKMVQVGHRY